MPRSTPAATGSDFLVDEKSTRFLEYFIEFFGGHFSNCAKTDALFDGEKPLRPDEARLTHPAAFTIAVVQRNSESIPVRASSDLAHNQIRPRKIGNHQRGPGLFGGSIIPRKWNDNDFAGYRFDHAASSSGEFQSRPRTDSLSPAPLNGSLTSSSKGSGVSIINIGLLP